MPQIDACVLGAACTPATSGIGPRSERAGQARLDDRQAAPTPAELEWARFTAQTPHYVLSNTLTRPSGQTRVSSARLDDIAALKQQPGKDIYLVGGARTTASLIDAGLVDELRLIVYPLIAGKGKALFATADRRLGLELTKVEQLPGGRLSLIYAIDTTEAAKPAGASG